MLNINYLYISQLEFPKIPLSNKKWQFFTKSKYPYVGPKNTQFNQKHRTSCLKNISNLFNVLTQKYRIFIMLYSGKSSHTCLSDNVYWMQTDFLDNFLIENHSSTCSFFKMASSFVNCVSKTIFWSGVKVTYSYIQE